MGLERIVVDPQICHGKACIRGTRVPVHLVLDMMAAGETVEGILEAYPFLVPEDVQAALECSDIGKGRGCGLAGGSSLVRFLTDESIPRNVIDMLRDMGHEVLDVREQRMDGARDSEVAGLARD